LFNFGYSQVVERRDVEKTGFVKQTKRDEHMGQKKIAKLALSP
jgi:hypothetical protein